MWEDVDLQEGEGGISETAGPSGAADRAKRGERVLAGNILGTQEHSVSVSIFLPHYGKKGKINGRWGLELQHWFLVQISDVLE